MQFRGGGGPARNLNGIESRVADPGIDRLDPTPTVRFDPRPSRLFGLDKKTKSRVRPSRKNRTIY